MTHFEITMQKQAMVRRGIEEDLGLEVASHVPDEKSFGAQFSKFVEANYPNSKNRAGLREVAKSLAMVQQTPIYRVKINNNLTIDTDCYDLIDSYCPKLDKHYAKADDLPTWVQEKLAVLMVIDPEQVGGREVEKVGRRINKNIFWVYDYGDDTRKEGESSSTQTA